MRLISIFAIILLLSACAQTEPGRIGGGQGRDGCVCIQLYEPVCGSDGKTYSNSCFAECSQVTYVQGECPEA